MLYIRPHLIQSASLMASPPATTTAAAAAITPPSQPTRRPLRREGAMYLPSAAERAMEAAMLRSSSPPVEPTLGKRTREGGDSEDRSDSDADRERSAPLEETALPSPPSLNNLIAATLRYASKKKLRPEQRDEIEAFLSVSSLICHFFDTRNDLDILARTLHLAARPNCSRVFFH